MAASHSPSATLTMRLVAQAKELASNYKLSVTALKANIELALRVSCVES